jgi:dihydrofolate reductase
MLGLIAAVSPEGVIGHEGKIPWRHPGDLRRFARVTKGATVIMGRLTWESMNRRKLPYRRNIVIARSDIGDTRDVERFGSIPAALATVTEGDVWFIGGARIYAEAMTYADVIDLTYIPDHVEGEGTVKFPPIDDRLWERGPLVPHEEEPGLTRRVYTRRKPAPSPSPSP